MDPIFFNRIAIQNKFLILNPGTFYVIERLSSSFNADLDCLIEAGRRRSDNFGNTRDRRFDSH